MPPARDRFLARLRTAVESGTLAKLTLGKARAEDPSLRNLLVRPVELRAGARLCCVWRHATRDVTRNLPPAEALDLIAGLLGRDFLDGHLFTATEHLQFESGPGGAARLRALPAAAEGPRPASAHDRPKVHLIPADAPWLRDLGITTSAGTVRPGMAGKLSQIRHFATLLQPLLRAAFSPRDPGHPSGPLRVLDAGAGKGYLTFALAELLGERAHVRGLELRPALVDLANRAAAAHGLADRLDFAAGRIDPESREAWDVIIALHACDTATDDALALGVRAGARLVVVAPCCQHELRPRLTAPPALAAPLAHGIFRERHAEFATDALRALLLEWAGYSTQVAEFVGAGHTPKNLLISGVRLHAPGRPAAAAAARDFAAFYGIREQALARHLGFPLASIPPAP